MKISKIIEGLKISWIKTIYFNFHYLPFNQAIKLPILLYKSKLLLCKGRVVIDNENIKIGMIKLGVHSVSLYSNSGIFWENHGGIVTFKGTCTIGNASAISVGKTGNIEFGNGFFATANFKITSYHLIRFMENVLIAWDTICMDTSFHSIKNIQGNKIENAYAPIIIGSNNWIPTRCVILKGTNTPDFCVFGVGSILNKDYSNNPTHIFMAGNPLEVKLTDVWRDFEDDRIDYGNFIKQSLV